MDTVDNVPTILFYGHYDVIAAENEKNEWFQDPFKLSGLNGYLYGRGTSDNKVKKREKVYAVFFNPCAECRDPYWLLYLLCTSS